jgi:flagellar hook-associated protein 3 FlgL
MRVTEGIICRSVTGNLNRLRAGLQELNQQVASGKRLVRPSDDPVGAVSAQEVRAKLAAMDQLKRNADSWQGWLRSTENAITSAQSIVSRAREVAVQMSNATNSASQRTMAAEEVNNLLEEMINLGNTQFQGRYVFAGYRDDSDAFEVTRVNGEITAVTYAGDDGHHEMKVGAGSRLESSLTGEEVFQGSADLFDTLIELRDSLRANDISATTNTLDDFVDAGNNLGAKVADVGSRLNRLDLRLSVIEDTKLAETERLSQIEDADLVEVINALKTKELAYEAALQATASTQQLSLAAYL